ncbi:hypothetical protein IQ06DRAFT_306445 [Phaeosphaeriaceae sp. SRC1lsM3a]|nr:hypothetical protein IQ06DRAFT_306445 [Stagonospora sp. SRC1lsM3a]
MARLNMWFTQTCLFLSLLAWKTMAQETFTNSACVAATSSMNECAKRWDSIRLECKKSITTNTVWPGPCECAYYANDLPCFDEQAFCAAQVWTQVPQWFRDGVSSCIMKDATYTVRANLGTAVGAMGNPFTVKDLPGKATRTVDAGVVTGTPAQTGAGAALPSATGVGEVDGGLSTGAKAGFGVGIGVGVVLIAVMAFFIARSRRKPTEADIEEKKLGPAELHDEEARIHQIESRMVHPKSEMPGVMSPKFELGVRASTWLVELPVQNSNRNSQQRH